MNEMNRVQVFVCGPYHPYDCEIKKKYSHDRGMVVLPEEFTAVIVPSGMTGELQEILSTALHPDAFQGNR